jgi:uncharacterized protein (DUF1778 family)
MARPPKNADLRITLTADEKQLIAEAAALAQTTVASWLRPIILQAAQDLIANKSVAITPPNSELLKTAETFPPPPEWFAEDEDKPF